MVLLVNKIAPSDVVYVTLCFSLYAGLFVYLSVFVRLLACLCVFCLCAASFELACRFRSVCTLVVFV